MAQVPHPRDSTCSLPSIGYECEVDRVILKAVRPRYAHAHSSSYRSGGGASQLDAAPHGRERVERLSGGCRCLLPLLLWLTVLLAALAALLGRLWLRDQPLRESLDCALGHLLQPTHDSPADRR